MYMRLQRREVIDVTFCNRDECLCRVVEGTNVCEAGHRQPFAFCEDCGEAVPVHEDWDHRQPVWCLECYNEALYN